MGRKNRAPLAERIVSAADASLAIDGAVSPIDVFLRIGWLDPGGQQRWRQGRVDCLEDVVQVSPRRIAEALDILQAWAEGRRLSAVDADYVARTVERQALRLARDGDPAIERRFRTHWTSHGTSDRKRKSLAEKASRAPDLVAILPLDVQWTCCRCGGSGDFLMMENAGPACLRCVGLGDLEFLPAGDALLTRRVKARSARCAVVVRFSRSRRRYERQGLLVEPEALAEARSKRQGEASGSAANRVGRARRP